MLEAVAALRAGEQYAAQIPGLIPGEDFMIRTTGLVVLAVAVLGLSGCGETPQQKSEREAKEAAAKLATAFGTPFGANADQQKAMAAAAAAALATGGDPNMTPEERAKAQKVLGNIASGTVNPAASAYLTGLTKVSTVIATVKDDSSLVAAQAQLAPIFAEMKGPADQLNAMNKDDRDVAMGSSAPQIMSATMSLASSMMPLALSNSALADKVGKLLDQMPALKD